MDPQVPPGPARIAVPQQTFNERLGISPPLFALLALVAVFFLYQIVGGLITVLLLGFKPTEANVNGMRAMTGVSQVIFLFLPTLLMARMATFSSGEFFRLRRPTAVALLLPLVGIFSLQQVLQIYMIFQEKIPLPESLSSPWLEQMMRDTKEAYALIVSARNGSELVLVLVTIAVIPAVAEEFLFRGLVQRSLETALSRRRALIMTGVIFGAYHIEPTGFVARAALGIYLGYLVQRSDSLWTSVAAHFYNNCAAVVAVYAVDDPDAIITGNPHEMSTGFLFLTFWFFGVIFLVSTYLFAHWTRRPGTAGPPAQPSERP